MGLLTYRPEFVAGKMSASLGSSMGVSGCVVAAADSYTAPANVNFPVNAADVATVFGVGGMTPTYIWDCQATSGAVICALTGEPLVPSLFFSSGLTYGVATSGLEGGARTAIRMTDNTKEGLIATNSRVLDPGGGSVAWLAVINVTDDPADRASLGYGQGVNGDLETCGIGGQLDSSGRVAGAFSDGTTSAANTLVVGDVCDTTWHIIGQRFDAALATSIHMNNTNSHTRALSGLTWDTGNRSYFTVGYSYFRNAPAMDVTYILGFTGAAADAVTQASLATFETQMLT